MTSVVTVSAYDWRYLLQRASQDKNSLLDRASNNSLSSFYYHNIDILLSLFRYERVVNSFSPPDILKNFEHAPRVNSWA